MTHQAPSAKPAWRTATCGCRATRATPHAVRPEKALQIRPGRQAPAALPTGCAVRALPAVVFQRGRTTSQPGRRSCPGAPAPPAWLAHSRSARPPSYHRRAAPHRRPRVSAGELQVDELKSGDREDPADELQKRPGSIRPCVWRLAAKSIATGTQTAGACAGFGPVITLIAAAVAGQADGCSMSGKETDRMKRRWTKRSLSMPSAKRYMTDDEEEDARGAADDEAVGSAGCQRQRTGRKPGDQGKRLPGSWRFCYYTGAPGRLQRGGAGHCSPAARRPHATCRPR